MAWMECRFRSEVLQLSTAASVLLPRNGEADENADRNRDDATGDSGFPTLWLLHGLSDDHTAWLRRTSLERYVGSHNLAVVMPAVHRSFYNDMHSGLRYWTFLSEELPTLMRSWFRLSAERSDNFVAGLSMGGYGAFKWALRRPELFTAAASLSGALDMATHVRTGERVDREEWRWMFGEPEQVRGSDNDLLALLDRIAARPGACPSLYQCCGTGDFLYQHNLTFRDRARKLSLPLTYEEHAGEGHEWGYWDRMIQRVLAWLPLD